MNPFNRFAPLTVLFFCLLLAASVRAQADRFELGQRMRACETAWETQYNNETRRTAVNHLKQAVQYFFALKLSEAAREMDVARLALRWPNEPTPFARWAESLFVKLDARLIDASEESLPFTLGIAYASTDGIQPREPQLRLTLLRGKQVVGQPFTLTIQRLPLNEKLPLKKLVEADYTLRSEILLNGKLLASSEQTLSVAPKLTSRLERLAQSANALKSISTDAETARSLQKMLEQLAQKQAPETNFPAARLLAEAEALVQRTALGLPFYGQRQAGQFWLTLTLPSSTVPVRLLVPAAIQSGKNLPLIIALHGAGGSENLFFDGYGAGKLINLAEPRGWLVVAPRGTSGFTPQRASEIIDALAKLYPVDRQRVFLMGHSMGAAQAIATAQATPGRFAAVVALGGGGFVKETDVMADLPFLVAIGKEDFAYPNARKLAYELKKAGTKSVRFKEYADIEHMLIVQEALPDVFAYFDEIAQRF